MRAALTLAILGGVVSPSGAADYWLAGQWCQTSGDERLYIEQDRLGFNEHTICEWLDGAPSAGAKVTQIHCANVYPTDGEPARMDEATHQFEVLGAVGGVIQIKIDGASMFKRCED